MYKNIVELLKSKTYMIPSTLIKNYLKLNITEKELIFIIYIMNNNDEFNINLICDDLGYTKKDVMALISSLSEKNLLSLDVKDKKDYLNLEELYNKLGFLMIEKKEVKTDIYSVIESEFGRTLSPMEYEIVRAWIDNGFNEELIKEALKEAIYNHVTSLRYIDTILYEWNKKGYKVPSDIKKEVKKTNNKKELLDYDWLNEDE
ncbi:MAG: DnaD domain protein [Bacillales bacterium]|nr:DnaD domain protein [Bacillales bacterium]